MKKITPKVFAFTTLIALILALPTTLCAAEAASAATPASAPAYRADWRWVHGAVFLPTNAVNPAQHWDEYDPVINDRELHYASIYGINCVRVYLHYFIYLKKKEALLSHIEDFLTRADKYGIKVDFVFFDDCHHEPTKDILKANYQYPNPIFGVHNSRWLLCPGQDALDHYAEHRERLKGYVQDVVKAHANDPRIVLWETYNEPHPKTPGIRNLLKDSQQWIHETGSKIPVSATGEPPKSANAQCGDAYSDVLTWHAYSSSELRYPKDPIHTLNTECLGRKKQSVPGLIENFKDKTGFMVWEYGIGRDNCRFYWGETPEKPAADEPDKPLHGLVYADGHPWATDDIKAWLGEEAYAKLPVFHVAYFRDTVFAALAKESITPAIDFDLPDEIGIGSPDTSVHLAKDYYSIRWTGEIESPASGTATLFVKSDGAVKVTIDGHPVIAKGKGAGDSDGTVALTAGRRAKITVEYIHETGPASIHLEWIPPTGKRQILFPVSHP